MKSVWLRITDIDLQSSRICVDIAPRATADFLPRLERFVSRCNLEGIRGVDIFYNPDTDTNDIQRITRFAAARKLRRPVAGISRFDPGRSVGRGYNRTRFRFSGDPKADSNLTTGSGESTTYRIAAEGINNAVENINKVVAIVGAAMELDPRSALQLRLCIYELSTNTVEHATFPTDNCQINIVIKFDRSRAWVEYSDNSDLFPTITSSNAGLVGRNISTGRKRGLGLYMINRLSSDFCYERVDGCNTSSFSLEISRIKLETQKGG